MSVPRPAVPLVDVRWQHQQVGAAIERRLATLMRHGDFILGDEVAGFEDEFASFSGVSHCVGVASGTDAVELALRAAGIGAGDEVIVPANTFIGTVEAVIRCRAAPRLVDCDDHHLLMDPERVEAAVGPSTRALIPVHLFGQMAPMAPLLRIAEERNLMVIEDAAQCHGAAQAGVRPGTATVAAATSFYPGKNLGAYGDAGAVLTRDEDLCRRLRRLRDHGSAAPGEHVELGFNSRLDAMQAAVLRCKLPSLGGWNELRATAAARYGELLSGEPGLTLPRAAPGNRHAWHLYVVRVADRAGAISRLRAAGVEAGIHYPTPVHLQPAMRGLGYRPGDLPVAERAAREILSLPLYPGITAGQQELVVQALRG